MHKIIFHSLSPEHPDVQRIAAQLQGQVQAIRQSSLLISPSAPSRDELESWRRSLGYDVNLLPEDFDPQAVKLIISDMDSTLIGIECIDEIADFAGVKPQVSAVTEAAMRGELDFEGSLKKRVALLKGLAVETLEQVYNDRLFLNPGAETLLDGLRQQGIKFALVSGGFTFFTERLKTRLGLDFTRANVLGEQAGALTGETIGPVIGAAAKEVFLKDCCAALGIDTRQVIAMGDGANDLPMLNAAGLGIAYHAKPKVQAATHCALQFGGLDSVLDILAS